MGGYLNHPNLSFLSCATEPRISALLPSPVCCEAVVMSTGRVLQEAEMHLLITPCMPGTVC